MPNALLSKLRNKMLPSSSSSQSNDEPSGKQNGYQRARIIVLNQFGTGKRGAEIGVFKGDFSRRILDHAKPSKLYLIDPWQNMDDPGLSKSWYSAGSPNDMNQIFQDVRTRFSSEIDSGQVELCREMSGAAMARLPDSSLDFVYVDGDHRYEGVLSDLESAFAKVKPGGVIAADDHQLGGWWKDGVVRAVNVFAGTHADRLEIVYSHFSQLVFRKRA